MQSAILIFQIGLGVLLIAAILLQAQGSGLGGTWGGGGETYHTRRGLEKVLFYFTIIGIVLFVVSSITYFLV
jgi:preprotein translocase subunit SecG